MNRPEVNGTPRAGGDSESSAPVPGRSTAPRHVAGGTPNFPSAPGDLGEAGVALRFRASPIHGQGGFAWREIPAGVRLIEYVGARIDKAESLRRCEENNEYIFSLDHEFDLDGKVDWNPARLINHSCAPNCEALLLDGRLWIVSQRPIPAGEEITFNYGYDLAEYREHPCACGSPDCVGYMVAEEFFPKLRAARSPLN